MSRRLISLLPLAAVVLVTGCGGVDEQAEVPRVQEFAEEYAASHPDDRYEPVTVALGEPETIEHGNLSFDGDEARLVLCPGADCISDVGYYELTLEDSGDGWEVAASEYHVEDF